LSSSEHSPYYESRGNSLLTSLSLRARTRVYDRFYRQHGAAGTILDVGASSESASPEANFLEKLFPEKHRITAVGTEDASFLEELYPGLVFLRIEAGQPLPFADGRFDVAFSHAVIEHVVDPASRVQFVRELLRVAKSVFLTTPCPWFPIEPHTMVPFLHWLAPRLFYSLLDRGLLHPFYRTSNLSLMSEADLRTMMDGIPEAEYRIEKVKLLGFTSNYLVFASRKPTAGEA
jgi:SAM-dependent methyltransferase